jgi:hypothetical protein
VSAVQIRVPDRSALFKVHVRPSDRASAFRVPVIAEYFLARVVLHGVHVRGRTYSVRACVALSFDNLVLLRDPKIDVAGVTCAGYAHGLSAVRDERIRLPEVVLSAVNDCRCRHAAERLTQRSNEVLDGLSWCRASHRAASRAGLASEGQEHGDAHDLGGASPLAELPRFPQSAKAIARHVQLGLGATLK